MRMRHSAVMAAGPSFRRDMTESTDEVKRAWLMAGSVQRFERIPAKVADIRRKVRAANRRYRRMWGLGFHNA